MQFIKLNRLHSLLDPSRPLQTNNFYDFYEKHWMDGQYDMPWSWIASSPEDWKNRDVLNLTGCKILPSEWFPICKALEMDECLQAITFKTRYNRCNLVNLDTEYYFKRYHGFRMEPQFSTMLLDSISTCLVYTRSLTVLELEGVLVNDINIDILLTGLDINKGLKVLSLKHCFLRDFGCKKLCETLQRMRYIEELDLTGCSLGRKSCEDLAEVIARQRNFRLKRITLDNNPDIGNSGLSAILNELYYDLNLKILDVQRCGLYNNIVDKVLKVFKVNPSIDQINIFENDISEQDIKLVSDVMMSKYEWYCSTSLDTPFYVMEIPTSPVYPLFTRNYHLPYILTENIAPNGSDLNEVEDEENATI